jgi:alkylation response protein AidB-like acyl-CoA dehydrogenase
MAYGATEPEAGSDLGALKTTAVPEVDDDGEVVATGSTARSSGSATAGWPTSTPSSR